MTTINVSRFIVKVLKRNQFVEVKFKGKNSFQDIDTKRYIKLPDVPYNLSFKLLCMDSQVDSQNLTSLLFGMDKGFFFLKGDILAIFLHNFSIFLVIFNNLSGRREFNTLNLPSGFGGS